MRLPPIPEQLRLAGRWVGYPLFALLVFLVSLYATLPRARIRERVETTAAAALGADVQINDFGLTLLTGAGIDARSIIIRPRSVVPTDKPARYVIDDLVAHVGLIDAIRNRLDLRYSAHAYAGEATGAIRQNPDEVYARLEEKGVTLGTIPGLAQLAGLPLEGRVDASGEVTLPKGIVVQAVGRADVACDGCVVGDGKAKLTLQGNPMLEQGMTIPKLRLGRVSGSVTIEKGRATLKDFRGKSADIEVVLDGYIELREPLNMSALHLYLRVRPSDALVKSEPTLELVNSMMGPLARRSDGYLGFSLTGLVASPVPNPSKEPPPGVTLGRVPAAPPAGAPPTGGTGSVLPSRPLPSPDNTFHVAPSEPRAPPPPEPVQAIEPTVEPPPPPPPSSGAYPVPSRVSGPNAIPPPARMAPSRVWPGGVAPGSPMGEGGTPAGGSAGADNREEGTPALPQNQRGE